MQNVLITGAASGLGSGFLSHYFRVLWECDSDATIYALDLHGPQIHSKGQETNAVLLEWIPKHVVNLSYDITNARHIKDIASLMEGIDLDLVIHCAGIRGLVNDGQAVKDYKEVRASEDLSSMDAETMRKAFDVNVVGTFELLRACVPALKRRSQTRNGEYRNSTTDEAKVPRVIVMGSRMGSIGHNQPDNSNAGAAYAYRASKAAVNAIVRSFSVDVPEVIWTTIHPGRVETGLVRVKEDDAMPVSESIRDMVKLIGALKQKDSGRFLDRFGEDIPF